MKKLLKITAYALLMGLSYVALAATDDESTLVLNEDQEMKRDTVFQLIRKNRLLSFLRYSDYKQKKIVDNLPFRNLSEKLFDKAMELSDLARNQSLNDQKIKENRYKLRECHNLLCFHQTRMDLYKDYPAIIEASELEAIDFLDYANILTEMYETKIDLSNWKDPQKLQGLSSGEALELKQQVLANEIEEYIQFVEDNKDILEKVSKIVDNYFRITTTTEKKCRTIKKKKVCTSGSDTHEIKLLSDIMPSIMKSQENTLAIEAPGTDL